MILVAPSRCGKTPTTMYLALQHGIFVANYPLVDEDFESAELPRPVWAARPMFRVDPQPLRGSARYGMNEGPTRRRLARAVLLRAASGRGDVPQPPPPVINSSTKSVEEMSTVILQALNHRP